MEIVISKDSDGLSSRVADWLVEYVASVLVKRKRFTLSLSGGSTPKKLFNLLSSAAYRDKIDWAKLHFFWGDERFVPFGDERNNARMAYDALLNHVPVIQEHIHVMRTDLSPEDAVAHYEKILHEYFDQQAATFDLVFLGLGDNAHTLSLFPGYEVVHEHKQWVTAFFLKEQDMYRITLTAPVTNKSSRVAFLVTGLDKAQAVERILHGPYDPDQYPAQVIQPENKELYWFLDSAAASALPKPL